MIRGTVAAEVWVVGILAGSTVGAEQVSVGVLLWLWDTATTVVANIVSTTTDTTDTTDTSNTTTISTAAAIGFGVFAVLTGPALSVVSRVSTIAGVGGFPVFVEGIDAGSTVEAMCVSALDSRNLAVVSEPVGGAFLRL